MSDQSAPHLSNKPNALAFAFGEICLKAAVPVMRVYASEFTPAQKADRSPVTEADTLAEAIILDALQDVMPQTPVLAEESFSDGARPEIGHAFILVDPVDGTKEFIAKRDEFTINIAYIEDGCPVAGAVYAPALNRLYLGGETAFAANIAPGETLTADQLQAIEVRTRPEQGLTAIMSRSHPDKTTKAFADAHNVVETLSAGSSLKFCRLAEGQADLYPRFAPTMEWDTGAGHAVLAAAGGCVSNPDGSPFVYGKTDSGFLNGAFIGWAVSEPQLNPAFSA